MPRLRTLPPTIRPHSAAVAKFLPKAVDDFYRSPEWQVLRRACLQRANYRCEIALPGCQGRATIADHIVSRRAGGEDTLANLRAACRACDNRLKEDHLGDRRGPATGA